MPRTPRKKTIRWTLKPDFGEASTLRGIAWVITGILIAFGVTTQDQATNAIPTIIAFGSAASGLLALFTKD